MEKIALVTSEPTNPFVLGIKKALEDEGKAVRIVKKKPAGEFALVPTQSPLSKFYQLYYAKQVGLKCVPWTDSALDALAWLISDGTVICKNKKEKVEVTDEDSLEKYSYFSRVFPESKEYRVHICNKEVIHTQEKKKKNGVTVKSEYIKTLANGYVYCTINANTLSAHISLDKVLQMVSQYSNCTYCAVDVVVDKDGTAMIADIYTTPVVKGETALKYFAKLSKPETVSNEDTSKVFVEYLLKMGYSEQTAAAVAAKQKSATEWKNEFFNNISILGIKPLVVADALDQLQDPDQDDHDF